MDKLFSEQFFMWASIINYGILILWFIFVSVGKDLAYGIHGKIFDISREQFNLVNYSLMGFYKLSIFLFFIIPWIVIRFIL